MENNPFFAVGDKIVKSRKSGWKGKNIFEGLAVAIQQFKNEVVFVAKTSYCAFKLMQRPKTHLGVFLYLRQGMYFNFN